MAAAMGNLSQFAIGASDPVSQRLDARNVSIAAIQEMPDFSGMRGTRSRGSERVRESIKRCNGSAEFVPTAVELSYLLPWILGGTVSGTTYPLGDSMPERYVTVDRVHKVHTYNGVKVDKGTFSAKSGDALHCQVDMVGKDETQANAGTFPSLTLDSTTKPFMLHDLSLTVDGNTVYSDGIMVAIDNKLNKDRFLNSITLTEVTSTDRLVNVQLTIPYGDSGSIYPTTAAGVPVVMTFTNGTVSVAFTFAKVVFKREAPTIRGRNDEIMLVLNGEAKKSGSDLEVVVTLDSTP